MMSQQLGSQNSGRPSSDVLKLQWAASIAVPVSLSWCWLGGHVKLVGRWPFAQGCTWTVSVHRAGFLAGALCMENFSLLCLELSVLWRTAQQVLIDLISGFFKGLVTKTWLAQTPDSLLQGELKAERGVRAEPCPFSFWSCCCCTIWNMRILGPGERQTSGSFYRWMAKLREGVYLVQFLSLRLLLCVSFFTDLLIIYYSLDLMHKQLWQQDCSPSLPSPSWGSCWRRCRIYSVLWRRSIFSSSDWRNWGIEGKQNDLFIKM